ncbi:MAG TPA: hypothetical protein ENN67_04915 [Firmicutes bacterium]|nr:hypothetical protein [Bacillota bacterium]
MRILICIMPLMILLTACPSPKDNGTVDKAFEIPEPMELSELPMNIPSLAVNISIAGRFKPLGNNVWPESLDYERRTYWGYDGESPILFCASAGAWVFPESDEFRPFRRPSNTFIWERAYDSITSSEIYIGTINEINQPITFGYPENETVRYLFVGTGGESATRSVSIDGEEPSPVATIDHLWITDAVGILIHEITPPSDMELYAGGVYTSINRFDTNSAVFMNLNKIEVAAPDDVVRLVDSWVLLEIETGQLKKLDSLVEKTHGAVFNGFLDPPGWFFFSDNSGSYVLDLTGNIISFPKWQRDDKPEVPPRILVASSYIPSVQHENSRVVFFDLKPRSGDAAYIVAIKFDGDKLVESDPQVIWSGEVPSIFGISTAITSMQGGRPFIVCIDPLTGEITAFDALLGSISFEGRIELADWQPGGPVVSFCQYLQPWERNPILLLHDPNANEIIQLDFNARTPGTDRTIRPVVSDE